MTVQEISERMSALELAEWIAFYQLKDDDYRQVIELDLIEKEGVADIDRLRSAFRCPTKKSS